MQTLHVNGTDMAYLEVGRGPPLVCVHGSLGDFRSWLAVIGPLSKKHRVIAVSLRHFFPEHWDGLGDTYSIARHVADLIGFIEKLDAGPVDLMGHSRGGPVSFRAEQRRPDQEDDERNLRERGDVEGRRTVGALRCPRDGKREDRAAADADQRETEKRQHLRGSQ